MAYAYQQAGPNTCNGGHRQSMTVTSKGGTFISIGVQNNSGSSSSFYVSQMYLKDATTAFIEVVNTGSDYINWSAWLVVDPGGSSTAVGVSFTAEESSEKN